MERKQFSYGVRKAPKQSGENVPSKKGIARLWTLAIILTFVEMALNFTAEIFLRHSSLYAQVVVSRIMWCGYVLIAWLLAWWTLRNVLSLRQSGFAALGVMMVTVILGWIAQIVIVETMDRWLMAAALHGADKAMAGISLLCDFAMANVFIITAVITTIVFFVVRHVQQR
ncbi:MULTISPECIES: hypothetical protein [unclassified Ligilactobacillus]|uniref:hypothetical protein n=1 Tax=unclassified Ligilactobacillus TaxID=2767920 RepID=UPI00385185DD